MTPEKFSEWLAAFSQTINSAPNEIEWQQIREVLASVETEESLTPDHFINEWLNIPGSC